ncbi:UbiX family flavin prenyltransferase [Desulfonauticus submarinus]
MKQKKIIIAITGASGVIYGLKLVETLNQYKNISTFVIISNAGKKVLDLEIPNWKQKFSKYNLYSENQLEAPMASGSWQHNGMVIIPCSMATLGHIAMGIGNNLIHRAADVCLKEEKKLILVPRETPLNLIHLKNMMQLKQAGATILPPCPNFYTKPKTISDLINQLIAKVLDHLQIKHNLSPRWGDKKLFKNF